MNERDIFTAAREIPDASAREVFLDEVCAGNVRVRERVQRLLRVSEKKDPLLDRQVVLAGLAGSQIGCLPLRSDDPSDSRAEILVDQFRRLLLTSGVISEKDLQELMDSFPEEINESSQSLADELVRRRKLTSYQAQRLCRGQSLVVGSYRIVDRLGEGGMGMVLKAEHLRMKRVVALKFLSVSVNDNPAAILRFQREVETSARLQHPNIVTAFDAGEVDSKCFLVMEYVAGTDLSHLVKSRGPLSVKQALECILDAAQGLEFAHRQGIIHRDIKPANLMLDQSGTLKVLDLGLARIEGDVSPGSDMTSSGIVMGTGDYISPEQAMNARSADARSDIYSLGISLWYLLTGKPAYDGQSIIGKLLAHREAPIPSIGSHRDDVPEAVEHLFRKMVAKNPQDRFQSMAAVVVAVEICLREGTTRGTESRKTQGPKDHTQAPNSKPSQRDVATREMALEQTITHPGSAIASHNRRESESNAKERTTSSTNSQKAAPQSTRLPQASLLKWSPRSAQIAGGVAAVIILFGVIVITITNNQGVKTEVVVEEGSRIALKNSSDHKIEIRSVPDAASAPDESKKDSRTETDLQNWLDKATALPAAQQLEAVRKELMARNSGFDGDLQVRWHGSGNSPKIENNVVTDFGFLTNRVTDISPLRALTGLKAVWCGGFPDDPSRRGQLTDLSPLRGMSLNSAILMYNRNLSDLSPLHGMPLTHLDVRRTKVVDLKPLRGMPLKHLDLGTTPVSDLSPLEGMSLTFLHLMDTNVSDLSPLKKMPLNFLSIRATRVVDLTDLHALPLEIFDCNNTAVSSLEPLRGMKPSRLTVSQTKVSDLSPLQGMPLTYLNIALTLVTDLSALKGMKLESLDIHNLPISDLSPLNGMQLKALNLEAVTLIKDLSPLRGMPLKELWIEYRPERDEEILRALPLERINDKPAAEFWKAVESGGNTQSRKASRGRK